MLCSLFKFNVEMMGLDSKVFDGKQRPCSRKFRNET